MLPLGQRWKGQQLKSVSVHGRLGEAGWFSLRKQATLAPKRDPF